MKKIVLIAFDDNYAFPAEVWLYNLAKVTPIAVRQELSIQVAYSPTELKESALSRIRQLAEALELEITFRSYDFPTIPWQVPDSVNYLSWTTWLRVAYFCESLEPFMYFDVDTLLLAGWEEIFTHLEVLTFNQKAILASKELNPPRDYLPLTQHGILWRSTLNNNYFNAGVLGMNPSGWKEPQNFDECMNLWTFLAENQCKWYDQDLLNYLFSDSTLSISADWNHDTSDPFMWVVSKKLSGLAAPKVLHFKSYKPWKMPLELKTQFLLSQLDEKCTNAFQLAQQQYFFVANSYRVFRRLSNMFVEE